jgi:hypothetical protein
MTYRLWVNEARTIKIEQWDDGTCTVAVREHPSHTWGPPVTMSEEKT